MFAKPDMLLTWFRMLSHTKYSKKFEHGWRDPSLLSPRGFDSYMNYMNLMRHFQFIFTSVLDGNASPVSGLCDIHATDVSQG